MHYVVQIENLSHSYGATQALDAISIQLQAGQTIGFIGPDGVGKSTLLSIISGVKKIQNGDVNVLNGDISKQDFRNNIYSKIAYMPQGLGKNLYMSLSVNENIEFFARLFGISKDQRKKRVEVLLKSVGLYEFKDRITGKLSGGMKQKLGLCCALIHDPKLLVLDEPTTGVDPLSRKQFWELIKNIKTAQKDMSVIVATAYMEEAQSFDQIVAMNDGKILAHNTPKGLLKQTDTTDIDSAFIALVNQKKEKRVVKEVRQKLSDTVVIEASNLTMRFGNFKAVDNVSLKIKEGEIFGFLGSNGCGKTTTMKMLTGLLRPSAGNVKLFGQHIKDGDMELRKNVGYMTQAFSLYEDLSVKENLILHAKLYQVEKSLVLDRVDQMLEYFDLFKYKNHMAKNLPLGLKQRLSLAVALIHEPKMLILDEPTSGVDPISREIFWNYLLDLAHNKKVTIFISTHFMNEGQKCDRISLMHQGKVLVTDNPQSLVAKSKYDSLQDVFIDYLEQVAKTDAHSTKIYLQSTTVEPKKQLFNTTRFLGYVYKESLELLRDPVRLVFAILGSVILLFVMGYGINMDVKDLKFSVIDYDNSPQSREYIEYISGSRYFLKQPPSKSQQELDTKMAKREISIAYQIPPRFGEDIVKGAPTQVGVWIDGTMTFQAETSLGYVQGIHNDFLTTLKAPQRDIPMDIQMRYRYNPDFKSLVSIVPAVIPMLLIFIPSILMAVSVVREKELGSITNFYATPVSKVEFLLGKQLPYVVLSMISFLILIASAVFIFEIPFKGNFFVLTLGALLYVIITTGIGMLFSSFAKTQIAALGATAIMTLLPTINFSGLKEPVSSLEGFASVIGHTFPATYFTNISRGVFSKGITFAQLHSEFLILIISIFIITVTSIKLLEKQEK